MADNAHNGRFVLAVIDNPRGFKPGRYFYAMHLATGRKVSRYLKRPGQVLRKVEKYTRLYAEGDHHWPEVTRCDELRDSAHVTQSAAEWLTKRHFGHYPRCLE